MFIRVGFITSMVIKKLHSFKRNMINNFLLCHVCPPSWTLAECWLGRDLVPGSHRFTSAGECKEMGTSANCGNCIIYLLSDITPQCHSKPWVRSNREGRGSEVAFLLAHEWRQELGGELYCLRAIRPDHTFFPGVFQVSLLEWLPVGLVVGWPVRRV